MKIRFTTLCVVSIMMFILSASNAKAEVMVGVGSLSGYVNGNERGVEFRSEDEKFTTLMPEVSIRRVIIIKTDNSSDVLAATKELWERQRIPTGKVRIIRDGTTLIIIE